MALVLVGIVFFGVYTYNTITYTIKGTKEKFIESHFDYPNCVSYIPYTSTTLKNTM
jgi:hypothetical protein